MLSSKPRTQIVLTVTFKWLFSEYRNNSGVVNRVGHYNFLLETSLFVHVPYIILFGTVQSGYRNPNLPICRAPIEETSWYIKLNVARRL
jgi:hypothetical protein